MNILLILTVCGVKIEDKTKTAISISKLIKLRLGDTFRVLIYHNERHIKQAERAIKEASK